MADIVLFAEKSLHNKRLGNADNPYLVFVKVTNTSITTCNIHESTKVISQSAFSGCSSLASITLPFVGSSLNGTDNTYFGYIFGANDCNDNYMYVPDSLRIVVITGGESIDSNAFSGCSSFTSITIPDSVTSIGDYAFSDCSSLTSIVIPDNVTSIDNYAFSRCSSLTSIEIPDSVTSIGNYAFRGCSGLTSITIPNSVTSIGEYAFYGCSSLTEVHIADTNRWCVDAFIDNSVSRYYGHVEVIDQAVDATSIVIPDSITSIGFSAFYGCSSLTSVTIGNGVTKIGDSAFSRCIDLESIVVSDGNRTYHSAGNCIIETESKTLIAGCKNSVIPDDSSVTSIGYSAFSECSSLMSIVIPDGVTNIGDSAFHVCSNLTSITIPDSVTSIGDYALRSCNNLTSITFNGTMEQWNAISKGSDWDLYTSDYTIHCTDGDITK